MYAYKRTRTVRMLIRTLIRTSNLILKDWRFVMKTREQLYNGEGAEILNILNTYHTLHYEQILRLFEKNASSIKALITRLTKQGRIYHDKGKDLLCDSEESATSPDPGIIAAFWVLLDFKKALVFHTSGNFPVKLHFFANDESYEIIYVSSGQEALINHVFSTLPSTEALRIVIIDSKEQAEKISIDNVIAYCTVTPAGTVSYYQKKEAI